MEFTDSSALRFIQHISIADALIVLGLTASVLGFIRKVVPRIRQFFRLLDSWFGDANSDNPEDFGVVRRLKYHENMMLELKNNGGSSVKDKVDQTHTAVADLSVRFDRHLEACDRSSAAESLDRQNLWNAINNLQRAEESV